MASKRLKQAAKRERVIQKLAHCTAKERPEFRKALKAMQESRHWHNRDNNPGEYHNPSITARP
jgi:hypothetical protein